MQPAGLKMEHHLHPVQAWVILPLFALFNAGVVLDTEAAGMLLNPISVGVLLGLVFGKQVGVFLFSWLAVRAGWAVLPDGVTWAQIYGVSCLAGIGFTMSLFISDLAFSDALLVSEAKIGILAASLIAGVWGMFVLWRVLPHKAT
jgi:NhaA family Na+:H+ antiporter